MTVAVLDRPEVQHALRRELARRELAEFCALMDPTYERSRHADLLIEHLEAVERGDIKRLAVFMPPRHSKTYHVSERFPAWFLGRNPTRRVIMASYGSELAEGSSRKVRNLLRDERWPFPNVGVADDSAAVNKWATNHGGVVIAAGVGGAMTGFGADCFPAGTMIQTEHGDMDIAHLSLLQFPPRVRSFNHETGRLEWRRIVAAREIQADGLVEVRTRSGRRARATPDHRFYVAGIGYVEAQRLQPGDRLVAAPGAAGVQSVRASVRATTLRLQQGDSARRRSVLLLESLFKHDAERTWSAALLSAMQRSGSSRSLQDVLGSVPQGTRLVAEDAAGVPTVPGGIPAAIQSAGLLHASMCQSGACAPDGGSRQLALQERKELRALVRFDAAVDLGARRRPLRRVWRRGTSHGANLARQAGAGVLVARASHQRGHGGQPPREPDRALLDVPRHAPQVEDDTVAVVRRVRGGRVAVYDIQVEGTRNFFANGLLVHNCLIIDDPVKGRAEADSETYRESTWAWYTEVARTRLMPGGRIVLCQTRWHEDDLAGRILSAAGAGGWTVLTLPAIADEGDALGRKPGEALWPEWYDLESLAEIKTDLTNEQGARGWHALYQQRPTSDEGGIFKRAWFSERYDAAPDGLHVVLAVDAAFKTGVNNDYSAIVAMGTDRLHHYVLDAVRERMEYPELRRAILDAAERWRPRCVLIEDTAAGQSAIQELRRMRGVPPILPMKVTASKEARAQAVAPLAEAGKVRLPARGPWLGAFVDEVAAFPTGQHDDQTDAFVLALQRCADVAATYRPAGTRRIVGRQGSIVSSGGY